MKLLTLAVNDVENVTAEYDFSSGSVDSPADAIKFLEYALFGNEALFKGKITLKAEYDGSLYEIERDFSSVTVVYKDGEMLGETDGAEAIAKIAGLKSKQWKENVAPVNGAEFIEDVSSFVKKYLSELGFDGEELEKRWDIYYKDHSLYVSKVEAYDELVDDSYIEIAAEKKAKLNALQEKLDAVDLLKQSAEEKGLVIALKNNLAERREKLLENEEDIKEKEEIIAKDDALRLRKEREEEVRKAAEEKDALFVQLDEKIAELEKLQEEIAAAELKVNEKTEEAASHAERAAGLRDSFGDILYANLDDKELTNAVVKKTEGVVATLSEDKDIDSATEELKKNHLSYRKRRAIREGVAFENSFDNSRVRIADLNAKIEQNEALAEKMRGEIAVNEALLPAEIDENAVKNKEEGLSLHEAKLNTRALEKAAAENEEKIRGLLKERKTLLEDLNALKKAKIAQEEYVRRVKARADYLNACVIDEKARLAFDTTVEAAEIGDICPVCNGRIYDKNSFVEEMNRVKVGVKNIEADAKKSNDVLAEGIEKLHKIEVRLSQLTERNATMVNAVNELSEKAKEERKELTALLASYGVKTVADLERKFRAFTLLGGDEDAVREHVAFLKEELEKIAATTEEDKKTLAEEEERLEAMRKDYDEAIRPELDGKQALDCLDDIIENERIEDELIAKISGDIVLGDKTFSSDNDNADLYVNVTAEIFADVMAEIKKSDVARADAEKEADELRKEVEEKQAEFNRRISSADELKERIDGIVIDEVEGTEEENVLDDETRAEYADKIEKFHTDLNALDIQIAALDGYKADEFDKDDYSELRAEVEAAEKAYNKAATRLAVSEAAKDLAYEKTSVCDVLTVKMNKIKKITDGELFDVVIPVINDVLTAAGTQLEARPDGLEIAFFDLKKDKQVALADVDADVATTAINCALNYIMELVTGEQTTRFAVVYGKTDYLVAPAAEYGVVVL